MEPALQTLTEISIWAFLFISLPALALVGKGIIKKKRHYKAIGGALFFVLLMVVPSGAFGETLDEKTTVIDMQPTHPTNKTINLMNVSEKDMDINTWYYRPKGVYVGPPLTESKIAINSVVPANTSYTLTSYISFSTNVLMSGASDFFVRLPIYVYGYESSVTFSIIDTDHSYTVASAIDDNMNDDQVFDANNFYVYAGRMYFHLSAPIYPNVKYKLVTTVRMGSVETLPTFYVTQFDVADDGLNTTTLKTPTLEKNIGLDAAYSFIFMQGISYQGVTSFLFHVSAGDQLVIGADMTKGGYLDTSWVGHPYLEYVYQDPSYDLAHNITTFVMPFKMLGNKTSMQAKITLIADGENAESTNSTDRTGTTSVEGTFTGFFYLSKPFYERADGQTLRPTLSAIVITFEQSGDIYFPFYDSSTEFLNAGLTSGPHSTVFNATDGSKTVFDSFMPFFSLSFDNKTLVWIQGLLPEMWNKDNSEASFIIHVSGGQISLIYEKPDNSGTIDYIGSLFSGLFTTLHDGAVWLINGAINIGKAFLNGVRNGLSWLAGKLKDGLQWLWNGIVSIGKWLYTAGLALYGALKWFAEQVIDFFQYLLAFLALLVVGFIYYFSVLATITIMGLFLKLFKGKYEEAADIAASKLKTTISMFKGVR